MKYRLEQREQQRRQRCFEAYPPALQSCCSALFAAGASTCRCTAYGTSTLGRQAQSACAAGCSFLQSTSACA